jgi:hypothetical protein
VMRSRRCVDVLPQQYPYAPCSQGGEAGIAVDWAVHDNLNCDQFVWESSGEFLDVRAYNDLLSSKMLTTSYDIARISSGIGPA